MYQKTIKERVSETLTKEKIKIKQYLRDTHAALKQYYKFGKFVVAKRDDLWKEMKVKQKEEDHIRKVAEYITAQNESSIRNSNKTLAEQDEEFNEYKLVGTIDRKVMLEAAGVGLDLAEKKKDERIKMSELKE